MTAISLILSVALASAAVQVPEGPPSDWAECDDCRISMRIERSIASALDDPFGLSRSDASRLAFTPDGDVWLAPWLVSHALAKFDAEGRLVTFIDREGQGPGEYTLIRDIDTQNGASLNVLASGRLARHDWDTGELVATNRVDVGPFRFLSLPNGSVVINGSSGAPRHAGYVLHLVDSVGAIIRSFGPETPGFSLDRVNSTLVLGMASDGGFWAGRLNRYRLEKYTAGGDLVTSIEREVDWFRPWQTSTSPAVGVPETRIGGLWEDHDGLLWVILWTADEDHDPERFFPLSSRDVEGPTDTTWDSIVEVLDPGTGEVLASRRFPQALRGFSNGRVVGFDTAGDGGQALVIMVPQLVR